MANSGAMDLSVLSVSRLVVSSRHSTFPTMSTVQRGGAFTPTTKWSETLGIIRREVGPMHLQATIFILLRDHCCHRLYARGDKATCLLLLTMFRLAMLCPLFGPWWLPSLPCCTTALRTLGVPHLVRCVYFLRVMVPPTRLNTNLFCALRRSYRI